MGRIDIKDRSEFIDMINNQIKIISDAGYYPNQLIRNKTFMKQAIWIETFVKRFKSKGGLKNIELVSYKTIKSKWQTRKWFLYTVGSFFIFNGMWSSYFFRSALNPEWKSNPLLETISTITTWLTLFFLLSFVLILLFPFLQSKKEIKKSEKSIIDYISPN